MQIDNEDVLKNVESIYSTDLMSKNREIAILRAVNNQLKAENDALRAGSKTVNQTPNNNK